MDERYLAEARELSPRNFLILLTQLARTAGVVPDGLLVVMGDTRATASTAATMA